jgi:GGDEF domain-containing protein
MTLRAILYDLLLQRVSANVAKMVKNDELVARFGGDEFVAVKPFESAEELDLFTEKLQGCFSGIMILPLPRFQSLRASAFLFFLATVPILIP